MYLHTKRLDFRWNDRQFSVPLHIANKIANGASRNLVVRGASGKLTADQIRDHLDHIHNLVVSEVMHHSLRLNSLFFNYSGRGYLLQRWRCLYLDELYPQCLVCENLYDVADRIQRAPHRLVSFQTILSYSKLTQQVSR